MGGLLFVTLLVDGIEERMSSRERVATSVVATTNRISVGEFRVSG